MNVSPEILTLLQRIMNGECDRSALAKWLAEHSLWHFESPDELDRMIVADLDVALGEIQRGTEDDEFLVDTANHLVKGLRLILPGGLIFIDMSDSPSVITFVTGSANRGGNPITAEVEPVRL